MATLSGEKTPLKITVCKDDGAGVLPLSDPSKSISLLINPAQIKREYKICFDHAPPMGDIGTGRKFSHMQPGKLSFSVVFDGTGVVPRPPGSTLPREVEDQLEAMSKVIYDYEGKIHQPNIVQILWGSLAFDGRLTSLSTDYTLFRPSGAPLRATVALAFDAYRSSKESTAKANTSSPDLSHLVEVRAGDTLPLLCHRIYGDSRYYPEVARFNGLRQFRALKPGMQLHFPPLD